MWSSIRKPYIDYRFFALLVFFIIVIVHLGRTVLFPLITEIIGKLHDSQGQLDIELVAKMFAGLATIAAGSFALWRWTIDQKWRRVQYAQQLLTTFFEKQNTKNALRMLDVQGITNLPTKSAEDNKNQKVELTEAMLIESLQTLDMKVRYEEPFFSIRMVFDEFFTDLSMFQHHIDAGLIEAGDVRPYLEYWIKSIRGYGKIYTIAAARQINAFLVEFDYSAVLRLSRLMGYTLNPGAGRR
jgi:hypothetical protein